jgi:hypothetical protein
MGAGWSRHILPFERSGRHRLYFTALDGKVKKIAGNVGSGLSAYGGGGGFSLAANGVYALRSTGRILPARCQLTSDEKPRLLKPSTAACLQGASSGL